MADTQPTGRATPGRGAVIERFGATPTRLVGAVGIAFAAFACVDVASDGLSASDAVVIAVAVFGATAAWMVLVRPRVTAYQRALLIHNLASDIEIPWPLVIGAEARQTLRIYTPGETFHAAGIVKTSRQIIRASRGPVIGTLMGAAAEAPGAAPGDASRPPVTYQDQVARRVMTIAGEQHAAQRPGESVVRRWALLEVIVLGLSALAAVVLLLSR